MFGAAKRAHHRRVEEERRQNEIRNFQRAQQEAQDRLNAQQAEARAREARFEEQNKVLMQQLQDLTIQNKQQIADQQNFYTTQLNDARAAAEAQISSLNDLMVQQKSSFDQQYGLLQQQKEAADAAYAEQQRIARNVGNAYVPEAQATAQAPVLASEATSITSNSRKAKNNELSSLSIVSRPGQGSGNNLAGLQIA